MELEYFYWYYSYERKIAKLSDSEVGRLVRALSKYGATGEREELNGREGIAFDFIADDIDRGKEKYADKCKTYAENRAKASNQQKPTTVDDGQPRSTMVDDGQQWSTMVDDGRQNKNKKQIENKNKTAKAVINPPTPLPEEWPPKLKDAVDSWFAYKAEKRQPYKQIGKDKLIAQAGNNLAQYGADAVAEVIERSIAANYQGIVWDWLKEGKVKAPAPAPREEIDGREQARRMEALHAVLSGER